MCFISFSLLSVKDLVLFMVNLQPERSECIMCEQLLVQDRSVL